MLKINSQKIALILVALITVACSDPKDKYIALECKENAVTSFNLILNKETMAWDAYESDTDASDLISGTYQEVGDHYYHLNGEVISEWGLYLDRRTLFMMEASYYDCLQDKYCSSSEELERYDSEPCKKIDLPESYLNIKSDLKTSQKNQI